MISEKIKLCDVPNGSLFLMNDILGFKSEYRTHSGASESFCIDSGEMFWGGTSNPADQLSLLVSVVRMDSSELLSAIHLWINTKKEMEEDNG